jgi:hypothetical protein
MLVRPASRWLHSAISVTGRAIATRFSGKKQLENGLEEGRIKRQRYMNEGETCILEGDHDVSCGASGRKVLCWGANIKQANRRTRRGPTRVKHALDMNLVKKHALRLHDDERTYKKRDVCTQQRHGRLHMVQRQR